MVFLDFWEPGDITDWDVSRNIMTCLDFMTVFGLGAATGMKEITSEQVARWTFENFFVTFRLPKMIVVDVDGPFAGMLNKHFQDKLLIPVHAVAREDHKAIRN